MEFEFITLDKCGEETEWLCHFIENIPTLEKPMPPMCIHYDNQLTIGHVQSQMYNNKSRHICCKLCTIKQLLLTRIIPIDYVKSKDNLVDLLTKWLNRELVENSSKGMELEPIRENVL